MQTGETSPRTDRDIIGRIQEALKRAGIGGWLFYDFRQSDPLAYRILGLDETRLGTRRWFYFIPAEGQPAKIVHAIEREHLDALPGKKFVYLSWQQLHEYVRQTVRGCGTVAMQYSPNNDIPYVSRVDAGTVELIRSFGVDVVSSSDLVAQFEAVWTEAQWQSHRWTADRLRRIIDETFAEIARRVRERGETSEYDVQQFMMALFERDGLITDHPPIVAVNAHAANPHYAPTRERTEPIREGDFVLIDYWAKKKDDPEAVYADYTWTGYVGRSVPDRYAHIFDIVRRARDRAIDFVRQAVRAGRSLHGWEIDEVARTVIAEAGYGPYFIHRTGHSIGKEVHGNGANIDNLETRDHRRILPHTAFSIEPGIYLEGEFGVRSEVDVYVTERDAIVTGEPVQTAVVAILAM
ncbi:MAG: aminopeptidase P family protein [Acidobacteria bacterium]|nr:MAG: aminopeptidase P family protein [Acidobacteriota bacterium]